MLAKPQQAVHFGAGNIGRGFIGPLLSNSGFHVTFIDVSDAVIDALNNEDEYTVYILDQKKTTENITDFSGLKTTGPDTVEALSNADVITTSVGAGVLEKIAPTIAKGISKRRSAGRGPVTIIACENMVGATSQLEEYVLAKLKGDDIDYVERNVGFANCEVDRIVPPFKGDDALDVGVEGFFEWVVEKKKIKGELNVEGMQLQDNLEPFLERKLYTLNCGHAMLAFLGHVKSYETINEAIDDEEIRGITRAALEESGAALVKKHGFDEKEHKDYIQKTMTRYANPNIHDELARVSRNPLRKLLPKERLVGAIAMCKEFDLPRAHLLKGVAAVFYFDIKDDEEAVELMKLVDEKGIEHAIEETTKFEKGGEENTTVLKEYENLKHWRK
ncbi:mannitol dehydrogenase domain-containing protein [Mycena floridula]|nr:mannitol dehydrogenase domain-containing protein [Mycena floridula]